MKKEFEKRMERGDHASEEQNLKIRQTNLDESKEHYMQEEKYAEHRRPRCGERPHDGQNTEKKTWMMMMMTLKEVRPTVVRDLTLQA